MFPRSFDIKGGKGEEERVGIPGLPGLKESYYFKMVKIKQHTWIL